MNTTSNNVASFFNTICKLHQDSTISRGELINAVTRVFQTLDYQQVEWIPFAAIKYLVDNDALNPDRTADPQINLYCLSHYEENNVKAGPHLLSAKRHLNRIDDINLRHAISFDNECIFAVPEKVWQKWLLSNATEGDKKMSKLAFNILNHNTHAHARINIVVSLEQWNTWNTINATEIINSLRWMKNSIPVLGLYFLAFDDDKHIMMELNSVLRTTKNTELEALVQQGIIMGEAILKHVNAGKEPLMATDFKNQQAFKDRMDVLLSFFQTRNMFEMFQMAFEWIQTPMQQALEMSTTYDIQKLGEIEDV